MLGTKKHWTILVLVLITTFSLLGFYGREVYRQAPPIPEKVVTDDGRVLFTKDDILTGQTAWQSIGGQQIGSIWGHGAYQAPDWSADWLHRECVALLDRWALAEHGTTYATAPVEVRGALEARLKDDIRTNRHDPATSVLTVSNDRAAAMATVASHYDGLFGGRDDLAELRDNYALTAVAMPDADRRAAMTSFFFWTAWATATNRPGATFTYTNNWPHEPLIDNVPTSSNVLWSIISVILLIAAIGALLWFHSFKKHDEAPMKIPERDPFDGVALTPSMRAVGKYCIVVVALFVVQVLLGALTAHYTVEGQAFFGVPIGEILPYTVTRTWHLQTAVFWIATSFLAAGLFLAPAVGGKEPKFQRLGVNVLFGALLIVVAGSLAGEWCAVQQKLSLGASFWFGHQGYEYVDLGRFWQIALFAGLIIWLVLMVRGLLPALARRNEHRQITMMFAASAAAIGLFYAAGFFYGAKTHLSVMEYWRWWVVHLWVEGFMEVFATTAIAFLFVRFGLIRAASATRAVLSSTAIFLVGGIPGTFHHLYFSGTPTPIMAVGACFSALEVVPLVLVGAEAFETMKMEKSAPWMAKYRWPLRFFVGTAFWNLVGAGVFGFLINPPIALYYLQGLNTTPVHAHAALFGVYGLLGLGLILVVLRRLQPERQWADGLIRLSFWSMNIGLGLMVTLSLLPVGILQGKASIEHGLWYARSAEFLQQPLLQQLRWARLAGDTVFLVGVGALVVFVIGLRTGWSYVKSAEKDGEWLPASASASAVS
jgi:nitric oxide reductase subunit B